MYDLDRLCIIPHTTETSSSPVSTMTMSADVAATQWLFSRDDLQYTPSVTGTYLSLIHI